MSVTVRLPSQLRTLVGGAGEVVVEATTVREAIAAVEALHPGLAARVLDDAGVPVRIHAFLDGRHALPVVCGPEE